MTIRSAFPATPEGVGRLLLRHKRSAAIGFLLVMTAVIAVIVYWPRSYVSEAKLLVGLGRESVTLDPTATTGEVMPVEMPREVEINSVLEMLGSAVMIEKVVDAIGPATLLGRPAGRDGEPASAGWLPSLPKLDPVSDRERAVEELSRRLDLSVAKKSNVIAVSCEAKTPKQAQQIVATLVDTYIDAHARLNRTEGSSAFFAEQAGLLQEKLVDALELVRDTKNEMGLASIASQREILRSQVVVVETDLAKTRAAHAAARAKVKILRQTVATLPERVTLNEVTGHPNMAADQMRKQLYDLEILEADLASRFTDTHPPLVAARREIEAARRILDQQQPQRTQSTSTINNVRMQLRLTLLNEQANVSSLAAQVATLEQQLAALHGRVQTINQHEVELVQLERQVTLCENNYTTYAEKLEQGRINDALQNGRITNVNVVQPANFTAKPVRPRKLLVLLMGLFGAAIVGVGSAVVAEAFTPALAEPSIPAGQDVSYARPFDYRAAEVTVGEAP